MRFSQLVVSALLVCGLSVSSFGQKTQSAPTSADTSALPQTSKASSDDLAAAYKKEFAFLQAQKAYLTKRLAEIEVQNKRELEKAQAEVDGLQGRVLAKTLFADRQEEALREAERMSGVLEDSKDRMSATMGQVQTSLKNGGMEAPDEPIEMKGAPAFFDKTFAMARELIARQRSVREEPGKFYLKDGTQVEGTLVKVGGIAAYGLSTEGGGALAPAGAGKLKVWKEDAANDGKMLAAGKWPSSLQLFLFESLDQPVEEKPEKTVKEIINSGGVIAWVIVCLGLLALLMIVARVVIIARVSFRAGKIVDEVAELLRAGKKDEALAACNPKRGAVARVLGATIRNMDRDRDHLEDIVSEAVLHEMPTIERFGSAITVCAAVAPLLGLLGTVTGMISTFDIITEHGTGDPKMLSGGISEALVTTELGLIVAIPTLLIGSLLAAKGEGVLSRMERSALQIMNLGSSKKADKASTLTPAGSVA